MSSHASMNRIFRLVFNTALGIWVAVAETARGRGKRSVRSSARLAARLAMLAGAGGALAGQGPPAAPVLAPTQLPTGGAVTAGAASINTAPGAPVLNVDQSTQRAVIDWSTFNIGSAAQVNFNQPNSSAATLNRVLDSNPSQIAGRITAPGQVFLSNPNGITFGKTASVDVGSLTATTHSISDADFMAGVLRFARNGATGAVVNEGELRAALGGYIALLAPEVRNQGVVIARLGTVAMAAGEVFTLTIDGKQSLTAITVQPSTIKALVENQGAVLAPGGLIVLSARALDRLQGSVVRNSGSLEATGLASRGGRIMLEGSGSIDNSGSISTNSGADGSPAGSVSLNAASIVNSGAISAAAGALAPQQPGGSIVLAADTITQASTGALDVSGFSGGQVALHAMQDIEVAGSIVASANGAVANGTPGGGRTATSADGGSVVLQAGRDVTLGSAVIDASGNAGGGQIRIEGGRAVAAVIADPAMPQSPDAPVAPEHAPTLALLGNTQLRSSSRRGTGGSVVLTADRVGLFDSATVDASGATGGGQVYVGGGFQGKDTSIANASQTVVARSASIDVSATAGGAGGTVVVWSNERTAFTGSITARGGATAGDGGAVEVSGKQNLDFRGTVNAGADHGKGGTLLLDPRDITVVSSSATALTDVDDFATTPSVDSQIAASTITAATNLGTTVTLQANNDITVNESITSVNNNNSLNGGRGGNLVFQAGRSIILNGSITSDSGNISFTANDAGAGSDRVAATDAVFVNNGLIDAGNGAVSITMGTKDQSGTISTGQISSTAPNASVALTITHNGPTAGAASGKITLGEVNLLGGMTITTSSARDVDNAGGNVFVRGTATISVGAGDVTITDQTTDFNILSIAARNVLLVEANAIRFGTSTIGGTLNMTAAGPINSTGPVTVAGTTTLAAVSGGFGFADPYITLSNPLNRFAGGITLSVTGTGDTDTGGSATIRDSGALNLTSASVARDLLLTAGGAVTLGPATAARDFSVTAAGSITQTGIVIAPRQTVLDAGSANDITLANASNQFSSVQVVSGKNVTLVDSTPDGLNFGFRANDVYTPSHVYGDLVVTAAGDISQTQYFSVNAAPITVDGAATFNTNKLNTPVNLHLGPTNPFDGNTPGSANSFAGTVTLGRSNGSGFTNVQLRNTSSAAGVLAGLGSVGALNNVFLKYDSVPSLSLPGMTLTGSLKVLAPSVTGTAGTPGNVISQTGAITVAQNTIVQAGATGDVVLTDAGNDFNTFGVVSGRNLSVSDANAVVLWAPGYNQTLTGNYTVVAPGGISDTAQDLTVTGRLSLNAGSGNISMLQRNNIGTLAIPAANNVALNSWVGLAFDDATVAGTMFLQSYNNGSAVTQLGSTAVNMTGNGTLTFGNYGGGITLANSSNVLGPIAFINAQGTVNIRENDAITQASAWSNANPITLTTSDDQAITMGQAGNYFGNLTVTQINNGAGSAGAVLIRETADGTNGMTQGSAWTVHGTTTLDSGTVSITLNNANNVFGPLQVSGATGSTNGVASSVTLYAKNVGSNPALTDVGGSGAWATGSGAVKLVAYDATGATAGGGNINLANTANVLGDLYLKATNVTITEADTISDGAQTAWNPAGDTGWMTTGNTTLIVANPAARSITLDNLTNQLGPVALSTAGTPGNLASVLITDNTALTQAAAWTLGATPVTLNARNNAITLNSSGNVMGAIAITTSNGTPTAVTISEDDAITQASAWVLPSVPVTLTAENGKAITLTSPTNVFGNLTITGGTVSITENADIRQGGDWTTTGTTTLNATANAITLNNAGNVLGDLAISGTPTTVSIRENDDITQASAWVQTSTPFTLNAGTRNILLTQANNQLGDLTLTAQDASVTENRAAGITDGSAWSVPGTTTLNAGSANPIVLNANPASNFGTVSIVSASNADIADADGIVFAASTVANTLTVTAGGAITQSGAINAPSLRLIGTGSATLNNAGNAVNNLAAGFTGGNLVFTNGGNFAVAVIGGTSGVTIGGNGVALTSATGTISGLTNVNPITGSLNVTTGTGLSLPQLSIAGAQSYTASTVSGSGITLNAGITSTAAGAITFNSPVTLAADLSVQSTNSGVNFNSTLAGGTNQLTVNAGSGAAAFGAAVSGMGATGDAGVALQVSSGGSTFASTLGANNGLAITGPVTFNDNVTLADGNASSVFAGLVTFNRPSGLLLSGYDGMTFNNGALLQSGSVSINTNNAALVFQSSGSVSGPYALTLNAGTQTITGLDRMGATLSSLTVTALNPATPGGGISIAGPQTYTATSGSNITVGGNVSSTAAGAIVFNSPVTVGGSATVASTNSSISFAATVDGNRDLTVNAGAASKTFNGTVGSVTALGDGSGAALTLQGAGPAIFNDTVAARSGIAATSPVFFNKNVTLGDGDTGSSFSGLVTSGGSSGNNISGYDGVAFNAGLALSGGAVSVASNGSTISFGGPVTGTQNLTLNALAGGAGTVTGLDQIGASSSLTRLAVTGQTLSLPSTGLAVAGPMSFTAAGGIALNGAVGSSSGPATGPVDFTGPVILATGAITVTNNNAAVNFNSTVNGAQALDVNAGTGTTTFGAAVGASTPLTTLTTDVGGTTALNGGSVRTSGAQAFNDAVVLGAATTLTGGAVTFNGTVNGANALTVNSSGTTTFGGVVGGSTALASITTDAAGDVAMNTTAVTTSGAQTYNDAMGLGVSTTLSGTGLAFNGSITGARGLTANAGSGALVFSARNGDSPALTSLAASGNTISVVDFLTSGAQSYTAPGGITLSGNMNTAGGAVSFTGPITLADFAGVYSNGGDITLVGATTTVNSGPGLELHADTGNIVLGGAVGGISRPGGIVLEGNNITMAAVNTVGDQSQTYLALNNITLTQGRTSGAAQSFTADADNSGSGSFILQTGVALAATNRALTINAADIDLQGSSTVSTGSGLLTLTTAGNRNIALGGNNAAGQLTVSGDELSRISSSGGMEVATTGSGWIHVNGITAPQSQGISGLLLLKAQGTGDISFITAASAFNAVSANATGGPINVAVNLSTSNDPIVFATPTVVTGAATINSGGGAISFLGTLAVNNALTLTTGNGTLGFNGAVGGNQALTFNLGGGSVTGLGQLQNTLTGLTVNSTSGITLPAFAINGPEVFNTGSITVAGNQGAVGIAYNNNVNIVPASGNALTLNAGSGTLAFNSPAAFNANAVTLKADNLSFAAPITGTGNLVVQPATASRGVLLNGGAPVAGQLNLTTAALAYLPIGTLARLTIGDASGSGTLDVAGVLNIPGTPLTLNGGGGITQTGGSIASGALTLYAAGNAIQLANGANAFGAVAINGTPSSVNLVNTLDITQQGSAGWNLGSAPVTLNAGNSHDIILTNAGNTFGALTLSGRNANVVEAAATDLGVDTLSGNLTLLSSGVVTQSGVLTIGGNLDVSTTVAAGDVSIDNSAAAATSLGDTRVGGNYVLVATGQPVSQAAGATLQVRGDLTITGASVTLGGAGNLVGGTTTLPAANTVEVRQAGVVTLGNRTDAGNLTVVSERSSRSFGSAIVNGNAVVLNNPANHITGSIAVSASPPTIVTGADQQTGIVQTSGTTLSVAGVASFTAEASSAGSLGIQLTNTGNDFGVLQLSGNTVDVRNLATGLTTIANAGATTSLTLQTAGAIAQTGAIVTPALAITAQGSVALNTAGNDVNTLAISTNGQAIGYVDANGFAVAGIDAGHAAVGLTAGGAGSITQTAAVVNVSGLTLNAGGAITLLNSGNTVDTLTATAGTGLQFSDSAGGLAVAGNVRAATGDLLVRTVGDLTLNSGSRLQADTGGVIASTGAAGNFINNAGASALVVGSGNRWLVYTDTPDLVAGAHTVKGGLTSGFRHYGANLATYSGGSVTEAGNGFIYNDAAPTLTVSAIVNGAATQVYGSTPTGTLGYAISAGLVDSEDNVGNIISGGSAAYSGALANTMNAGVANIRYTGGLVSNYTLAAATTGVDYTVTQALLTYTANAAGRAYGAANPALGGSVSGFVLGQTTSSLSGSVNWTTPAVATSNTGSYAVNGSGYTSSNYSFAQAAANSTAFAVGQASLTVTATGFGKTYDGTAYSGGNGVSYGAFANGEDASVLGGSVAYGGSAQGARNAGSYLITPMGLTSGNYAISYASGTLVVGRAGLTLVTSDVSKTYDGSLAAAGNAVATAGTQLFGSDSVSGGSFAFTNANAASGNKTVTASGVTVSDGNGGNNYTVSYANNTTSTINRASLTVASSDVSKTYDGNLSAAGTAVVVGGTLFNNASNGNAQDAIGGGSFAFTDANAGVGNKTVATSGVTLTDGNGGGNYDLAYANNTTSTIAQKVLSFSGSIATKVYDGNTTATLSGYTLGGLVGSETLGTTAGSANFADQNAAVGKTVDIGGLTLADGSGLAANYSLASTATAIGTVTPKLLTAAPAIANKVYDGATAATLQGIGLSGLVGSESLTGVSTGSTTFADKNAGIAKPVTVTGVGLTGGANGGLVGNYTVASTATGQATITQAQLQVAGVVGVDKVYDGALTASLNTQSSVLTGRLGADDVQMGSIAGNFLSKNVGSGKSIVAGAYVLNGTDALNYTLLAPTGLAANVTPRSLAITAVGIDKVYDTTTVANITLGDNRVVGDVLAINGTANFADKNVGAGKFISVAGLTVGGTDAGNYVANTGTATFAAITRAALTISATAAGKVYDAGTSASASLADNRLGGDVLSLSYTAAGFANKNAGIGKTVNVSGIGLSGTDAGNYSFNTTAATSADITPAVISAVSGYTAATKVYDGSTAAQLAVGPMSFAGLLVGDSLTASATGAVFNDKNAGVGKAVTVNGLVLGGTDAGNYTLQTTTGATTGTITQAMLTVSAVAANKVYDATNAATATLADNRISGDALNLAFASASFADKNAGIGRTVNVSGIGLTGADAGNYSFNTSATALADIAKAGLTVGAVAANKVYDGSTAAGVTLSDNRIGGDMLSLSYGSAAFADKNAGIGKTVTVGAITLGGADAGNYIANTSATSSADIAKATLAISASAANKVYDGSTTAAVTLADNRISGDALGITYGGADFADRNAGVGKIVTVAEIALSGADAGNYTANTSDSTTANIAKAALTVAATGIDRVYDAGIGASVSLADNRVAGDALSITASASFLDKNVGIGKFVNVSAITLSGADAGNYLANTSATTFASIRKAMLTVSALGNNKVYDAGTAASVTLADDRLGSDQLNLGYTSAAFADKNAGLGKTVTVSGIGISGADAGNYSVTTLATTTADIAKAALTVSATGIAKVYDTGTNATVGLGDNRLGSDQLSLSYASASFADKAAGTAKAVTVGGISISGADAGNYTANTSAATTADIAKAALTVSATGVAKVYDSSTSTSVTLADNRLGSDQLSLDYAGAAFADKSAGLAKTVLVNGINVSGVDAGNYSFNTAATTTADIAKAALTVSAAGVAKVYDTGTTATVVLGDNRIGTDQLNLGYTSAAFADKNAGLGKTVTVSGIGLTGADAGNYSFNTAATTTADIAKAALTVSATGIAKVYDTGTNAAVTLGDNRLGSDQLSLSYASASFADKTAGTAKTVLVDGIGISGADAGNYTANVSATTTADIAKALLTVNATGVAKVYDSSTSTTVTLADNHLGNDQLGLSYTSAAFGDKSAGIGKGVVVNGIAVSGVDAVNYSFNPTATTTADIAKAALTVSATGIAKVYDTGTTAAVTLSDNRLGNDQLNLGYTSAAFADKSAGTAKTVTVNGIGITGADAGNYSFNTAATTTSDIAKALLTVSASGGAKVYDGKTGTQVTLSDNHLGNDVLTLAYTSANYANKRVGTGMTVTVDGIRLSGADAGNYSANTSAATTASIAAATLTAGVVAQPKPYDGSSAAIVTITDNRVAGDDLSLTHGPGSFADSTIGVGKIVTVKDIAISGGADRGNYVLANTSATTTADIGARSEAPSTNTTAALQPVLPPSLATPALSAPLALMDLALPLEFPGTQATESGNQLASSGKRTGSSGVNAAGGTSSGTSGGTSSRIGGTSGTGGVTGSTDTTSAAGAAAAFGNMAGAGSTAGASTTVSAGGAVDGAARSTGSTGSAGTSTAVATGSSSTGASTTSAGNATGADTARAGSTTTGGSATTDAGTTTAGSNSTGDSTRVAGTSSAGGNATGAATSSAGGNTIVPGTNSTGNNGAGGSNASAAGGRTGGNTSTGTAGSGAGTNTTAAATAFGTGGIRATGASNGTGVNEATGATAGGNGTAGVSSATGTGNSAGTPNAAGTSATSGLNGAPGNAAPVGSTGSAGGTGQGGARTGAAAATGAATAATGTTDATGATGAAAIGAAAAAAPAGGATGTTGNGTATDSDAGSNVSVSLVRTASGKENGLVAVLVPQSFTDQGKDFAFPLPVQIAKMAGSSKALVTLADGGALPTWLRYTPKSRSFNVTGAPAGALPVQLLVRVGKQRWAMDVTARKGS